ncbi:hypothetical protein GJJ64_03410 [Pedobacter sp. HX-22-1]|uniref:Uncharacterized protein n=1 Tax=Pedobacter puniceum TaxID=2666136 RepID=A0A7K0FJZ3_9SPHI|nr:hypothetical protein [Pedobacter puniceum]MRX46228.1 hypothetical protein [Pedobacter puniceum]
MKANHNSATDIIDEQFVVVNISSSKNESKSQLSLKQVVRFGIVVNISSSKNESKSQFSYCFYSHRFKPVAIIIM